MDRIEIGALVFVRSAAAADDRLEAANMFKEKSLDLGGLAFDTLEADIFTKTKHKGLSAVPGGTPVLFYREERQTARFFTRTIRRTGANSYHVSAISAMSVLTTMPHPGGIYTGQTAEEVIRDICGGVPVAVKSSFAKIALYGWLPYVKPPESSARDNLSQVLFAIGASLGTDLDGVLRVEPLWDGTASAISTDRMYGGGSVEYGAAVTAVTVMEHQYVQGGESKELFSGTTQEGDVILFDGPMHSLSASGFAIRSSGANHAVVSAGSGTLSGRAYIHTTRQVTEPVTRADAENVKTIKDATLVSLVNSTAVAKRLADYYRCRETIQNPVVAGEERPGDVVSIYHPYDKTYVQACIDSADTTLSATLKSDLTALVGFKPPKVDTSQYYDERVVLTGSGSFQVPSGTTSIRVVCISGGGGGDSGACGKDADPPEHLNAYGAYKNGAGASGGSGGSIGKNGKVKVETITVSGGDIIRYSCGTGGAGGISIRGGGNSPGGDGGESVFGPVTSADGVSSETGYVDDVTGDIYANTVSLAGIPGGAGSGASGQYMNTFVRGASVFDRTGKEWVSGLTGDQVPRNEVYLDTIDGYDLYIVSISGSGGGAAAGANGSNGYPNSVTATTAYTGTGGTGASATIIPEKQTCYGSGGHGGHGGGGAGGAGSCASGFDSQKRTFLLGPNGIGGMGGSGGDGADGCVILYYRAAKEGQSGPFVVKGTKWLLDKHGRRIIV